MGAPLPWNEPERLAALRALRVAYDTSDVQLDDFTRTLAQILEVPIAVVKLVEADTDGARIGTLCIMDVRPHADFDVGACSLMVNFAALITRLLESASAHTHANLHAGAITAAAMPHGSPNETLTVHTTEPATAANSDQLVSPKDANSAARPEQRGIAMIDTATAGWPVILINKQWMALTGMSGERAKGRRLLDICCLNAAGAGQAGDEASRQDRMQGLFQQGAAFTLSGAYLPVADNDVRIRVGLHFSPAGLLPLDTDSPAVGIPISIGQWTTPAAGRYYFVTMLAGAKVGLGAASAASGTGTLRRSGSSRRMSAEAFPELIKLPRPELDFFIGMGTSSPLTRWRQATASIVANPDISANMSRSHSVQPSAINAAAGEYMAAGTRSLMEGKHVAVEPGLLVACTPIGRVYRGARKGSGRPIMVKTLEVGDAEWQRGVAHRLQALNHVNIVRTYASLTRYRQADGAMAELGFPAAALLATTARPQDAAGLVLPCETLLLKESYNTNLKDACDRGYFLLENTLGVVDRQNVDMLALLLTAQDVALGMQHLHKQGLAHGLLEAGNVALVAHGKDVRGFKAKVAGLELVSSARTGLSCGADVALPVPSLAYLAPELWGGPVQPSQAGDVFAFGVLLWVMFTAQQPWAGLSAAAIQVTVVTKQLRPVFPPATPAPFRMAATACMAPNPADRPSFATIVGQLAWALAAEQAK
ncbi:hypothetical protein WJX72_010751 [[Myrmecia] bisecta]|uniref:Protein kinase domain-containing protein n=1 Tax=[Myrmecia] bisecta TaxID=41462 RepID=A0AAW1PAC0_9CHLO